MPLLALLRHAMANLKVQARSLSVVKSAFLDFHIYEAQFDLEDFEQLQHAHFCT